MAVEFLTDEQAAAYGRFGGEPTQAELERFFLLDQSDRDLIAKRRGDHMRLGFAVQLGTVRCLGTFLADPLDVPWPVVEYLADQLRIDDPSVVKRYTERLPTQHEHARQIRAERGYREFSDPQASAQVREFMAGRAWTCAEGPLALFEQASAWLRRHRVLLPGASVLARLVVAVRAEATERLHRRLAEAAHRSDPQLPERMRQLLEVVPGQRISEWERLRRAPTRTSGPGLEKALARAAEVSAVGAGAVPVAGVPANRLATLARYGLAAKAPALKDLAEPRCTATLLAATRQLEAAAVDDALDLFDLLMATRLINPSRRACERHRLAALPQLEKASRTLASATRAVLQVLEQAAGDIGTVEVAAAWRAVEQIAPREQLLAAVAQVEELVPDDSAGQAALRAHLATRYGVVRPFLVLLAEALPLDAAPAGQRVLAALRDLPDLARRRIRWRPLSAWEIDADIVPPVWRRAVFGNRDLPEGAVDRDAYVLCVLEQLRGALRRRDVFACPSVRWADPRTRLLDGPAWQAVREETLAGLGLAMPVHRHLSELVGALDAAWHLLAERLEQAGPEASVRLVPAADGRVKLAVDRLEAVGESDSLKRLRATVAAMLPCVDLPELLLEVHAWTGFLDAYTHVAEVSSRLEDLPISIAALLVAEGCNVGRTPVINPGNPALTRDRLSHVDQNYLRAETHTAANARLIDAQAKIPIVAWWGGGLVASVDGLRFVVPVRTINAAPSPRYFGLKRGLTWLNAVNDQVAGIGAVVVPGTVRDSLFILDALLNLDAGPKPEMVATDTASYSDIVFGLFRLLGYRFSPRIADLADQRFWRATLPGAPEGDYGPLNALARNRVDLSKIGTQWPDMLRVAGSLVTDQVRAYDLLRMLGRDGRPTRLGQAFTEYGRIAKTLHLLALVDPVDEGYRRTVTTQLTVQESRHRLARKLFHGQRGELRQPYREGQEDQLGALGLVLNAVVLWNSRYIDAAVTALRAAGHQVDDADIARLSPLGHAHINMLGRHSFTPPSGGGLRPLRDPSDAETSSVDK
ncbi:transposase [Planomonospora sphaerica]|uniref:Transposase n=1 Tax=Planomonospora sphaerica TaxID=161355 RepID=A0A171DM84_9ACTN|nr:Tn3 family transposase [Planomonospora sphaerica]GAT70050.1 transposase [Planomonospora sphaerica]